MVPRLDRRTAILAALAVLILVGGAYVVIGPGDGGSGSGSGSGSDEAVRLTFLGPSLSALDLDRTSGGASNAGWTPYSGRDAPGGAFLGELEDGSDELTSSVTLTEELPPGSYHASIKGIDYDRHVEVELSIGGGQAKLVTDDRDENGRWTEAAPLKVDSASRELRITLRGAGGSSDRARLMLLGMYFTSDLSERVLADDQVVDLSYPRERDSSPPRRGNIIRDGSFETGLGHGWGLRAGRSYSLASTWYPRDGALGSASVRLPLDPDLNSAPVAQFVSTAHTVTPNKRHTLSVRLRTNRGSTATGTIRLVNSYDPAISGALPSDQPAQPEVVQAFEVGDEWQRVDVSAVLLDYPKAEYSIVIGGDVQRGRHLWIDGVYLHEGKPAAYAPRSPLEIGLTSGQPSNLFYDDEPLRLQLRVANATDARRSASVRYEIYDVLGRRVKAGRQAVTVNGRSVLSRFLAVDGGQRGALRAVAWVDGMDGSQEEVRFGVVPRPQRSGADPSSAIGIHSGFVPFTYDAMAKLGIKWDRVLSPAAFFRWKDVEPKEGEFIWYDEYLALAQRRGVMSLGVLGTNDYWPEWADRGGKPDLDKWEQFVNRTARHYRDTVAAWELWNEPLHTFEPEFYAQMLKRGAEAVKRVNPEATVVGLGGVASAADAKAVIDEVEKQFPDWPWRRFVDALSIHMYPTGESAEQQGAGAGDSYRTLVSNYGLPVWNTETGAWDRGSFRTENAPVASWGRQLQEFKDTAHYTDASRLSVERLTRNFVESVGNGLSKYFYYDMRVIASPTFVDSHPTLLEYDDGIRPKGIAYAVLAKLFDHSRGLGRISAGDRGTRAHLFDRSGTALVALYSEGTRQQAMTVPGLAADGVTVYDAMGNELEIDDDRIVYGRQPVYVEARGMRPERLRALLRAASVQPVADTVAPNLTIDEGPRGPVAQGPVELRWTAVDDHSTPSALAPEAITYSYRLDDEAWSEWSAGTSVEYDDLETGRHIFAVRARDAAGNVSRAHARDLEITKSP